MITNHHQKVGGRCPYGYDREEVVTEEEKNLEYLEPEVSRLMISHPAVIADLPSTEPFRVKIDLSGFPSILVGIDTRHPEASGEVNPELTAAFLAATSEKFPVVYSNLKKEFSVMQIISN